MSFGLVMDRTISICWGSLQSNRVLIRLNEYPHVQLQGHGSWLKLKKVVYPSRSGESFCFCLIIYSGAAAAIMQFLYWSFTVKKKKRSAEKFTGQSMLLPSPMAMNLSTWSKEQEPWYKCLKWDSNAGWRPAPFEMRSSVAWGHIGCLQDASLVACPAGSRPQGRPWIRWSGHDTQLAWKPPARPRGIAQGEGSLDVPAQTVAPWPG